jgi:hypothetical protein
MFVNRAEFDIGNIEELPRDLSGLAIARASAKDYNCRLSHIVQEKRKILKEGTIILPLQGFLAGVMFFMTCAFAVATERDGILEFLDVNGVKQTPLVQPDQRATVLLFVLPDCPISNAYAPEINRLADDYLKQKIAMFLVYVDPALSDAAAKQHAKEFGYKVPVIRDSDLQLVKFTGVTIAPEVAVLGPDGKCLYRGRIDNLYADYGKRRVKPTEHNLRDALDAIIAGKPVPQATTKSIGCYIPKPAQKATTPK